MSQRFSSHPSMDSYKCLRDFDMRAIKMSKTVSVMHALTLSQICYRILIKKTVVFRLDDQVLTNLSLDQ